jgi:hypothetical protein
MYIDSVTELYTHFAVERLALPAAVYECDRARNATLYSSVAMTTRSTTVARPEGMVSSDGQ